MKKIAFGWIMAAVLFAGCSKEDEGAVPAAADGIRTLTAVLNDTGTRAAFGEEAGGKVAINWSQGDQIATWVDGVKYVYRLDGAGGTPTGTFVLVGEVAPASVSEVYYPASALNEAGEVSLPERQLWSMGSFDPTACVLKSEVVGGVASSFRGEYAVLGLRLTGSGQPLRYVDVSSDSGASVSVICPYMPLGAEPFDVYIVFPAGAHNLTFKIITDGGTMGQTPPGAKTLRAGTLHRLPELAFVPDAEPKWQVGDYYMLNELEGIVFSVSDDGLHGKIVAMRDAHEKVAWSTEIGLIGAGDQYDGAANATALETFLANNPDLSLQNYPAFYACGPGGWYLPARNEARAFSTAYPAVHDVIQRSLVRHGGEAIIAQGGVAYWTSTEYTDESAYSMFMVGGTPSPAPKQNLCYVRPVAAF